MSKKVWLDAGHGGKDPGAVKGSAQEKAITLVACMEAKRILEQHKLVVGMTRTTDKEVSLNERARLANNWGADIFVSVHINAGGGDGVEVYRSVRKGNGDILANKVVNRVGSIMGQNFRQPPVKWRWNSAGTGDYYSVIANTSMSAIIVEGCFIDSADFLIMDTVSEQKLYGKAIAYGILDYYGIKPVSEVSGDVSNGGTSEDRYATVVNADSLNVRDGRGTNFKVINTLGRGTKVKLMYLLDGWWSIEQPRNITSRGWGFVSAKYLQEIKEVKPPTPPSTPSINNKVVCGTVINADELNVRSGIGTEHAKIATLKKGTHVHLLELKNNWWKIELPKDIVSSGIGYVSANYIQKH